MIETQKNKPIKKECKDKPFTVTSLIGHKKILKTQNKTYKINPRPIFINTSKKSMVFQLQQTDGKKFVGKLIRPQKQIQAITQIYFLNRLKGKEICNLVDIIKKPQGFWIISQKGHTSLFNYLQNLRTQEVQIILKNFVISYLPFYQKRIAHRDLKPGNIIIQEDLTVKFIDLQLCEKIDQKYGTLYYIPPYLKQIMWDSSDSFAYGMIAKQMAQKCGLFNERIQELIRNCINPNYSQKWGWKEIFQFWNITPQTQTQSDSQSQ